MADFLLTVVAHIHAKPGMEQQMKEDLLSLLAPTRAEAGCVTFNLLEDPKRSYSFRAL